VIQQTKARIFDGNTRTDGKLVSIFEPEAEIIRKGKTSKPTEIRQNGEGPRGREPDRHRL
jgi:hypothetical protein